MIFEKGITSSIGDIIKILQSSSSSNSASNSDNQISFGHNHSHFKLHALNAEIDKTMSEISKFKNEVSIRIQRHHNCDLNKAKSRLEHSTSEIGVNTDISMCNAIFSIQYLEKANGVSKKRSSTEINRSRLKKSNRAPSVKINELTMQEKCLIDMVGDEDFSERLKVPIVETPETSKNESLR